MKKLLALLLIAGTVHAGQLTNSTASVQNILDTAIRSTDGGVLTNSTAGIQAIIGGAVTNSAGITVGDTRYARSIYGGLHIHDSSAVTNDILTGVTYTRMPWTEMGPTNGMTVSTANSNMTLVVNGVYQVTGTFCFGAEGIGDVWRGAVFQDNVEQNNIHFLRKITAVASQDGVPFSGFLSVTNQPAVIDFRVRHDNGSAREIYVTYANFGVVYIGE